MSESITNVEDAVRVLGALPVPVGPELQPLSLSEAQIEALAAAGNRVVNDAVHEDLCMCDAWPEKCLSSGNLHMGDWDVSGLESALPAVLALWEQMRGGELVRLRAQVAALLAERHSTNESLSTAAEALRANRDRIAELETERQQWRQTAHLLAGASGLIPQASSVDVSADKLKQLLAPRDPDACTECGDGPSEWCPGCAKCSCVAEHDMGCARRVGEPA